jgi:hypothetical protein
MAKMGQICALKKWDNSVAHELPFIDPALSNELRRAEPPF